MAKDMTPEEYIEKIVLRWLYGLDGVTDETIEKFKVETSADLNSVIRGLLLKYEMKTWDGSNVKTIELNINKFLAENGLNNK